MTVYEIVGLPGSGKSTISTMLNKDCKGNDLVFKPRHYFHMMLGVPVSILVLFKTRKIRYMLTYLYLHLMLDFFKSNESINKTKVFDQGPIYAVIILIKEVPDLYDHLINICIKLLPYYSRVFFLNVSTDTIISRINEREREHRVKNLDHNSQRDFLIEHLNVQKKVYDVIETEKIVLLDNDSQSVEYTKNIIMDNINRV